MKKRKTREETKSRLADGVERLVSSSWIALFVLAAAAVIAYSNTFSSGFHFDDESSVVFNPAIRTLTDPVALFRSTPTRFLTYLSFAINYQLGGLNVVGYHIVNLLLHILTGWVVWFLVRRILSTLGVSSRQEDQLKDFAPLMAAIVFIVHPLQTQAVTYVAQRATVLATLFYLLSVYFFLVARSQVGEGSQRPAIMRSYALAAIAGFCGLLSKETILTLPFAFVLVDASFGGAGKGINWKFFLSVLSVFVAFSAVLIGLNLVSLEDAPAISQVKYLSTQPLVILMYIRLLFLPYGQNLDYVFPIAESPFEWWSLLSLGVILALLFLAVRIFKRERLISFGIFWYILVLMPESSVLPLADVIFEHRLYLPMFAFSLFVVVLGAKLLRWMTPRSLFSLLLLVAAVWTYLTFERNKVWNDEISLWSDVIKKSPENPRAYNNRGRALGDLGRYDEALSDFNRALTLNPSNSDAYNNRANILVQRGRFDDAIADCNTALALAPRMNYQVSRIYFNRGTAYVRKNQLDLAIQDFDEALRYEPEHESAHFNRGIALAARGDYEKAIGDYSFVLMVNPANARAFNNRGIAYRERGMIDSAIADFSSALRLQPSYGQALLNRGIAWNLRGELAKAEEDLNTGLRILPESVDGYTARGSVFQRKGELQKAYNDFERALAINPGFTPALDRREEVRRLLRIAK